MAVIELAVAALVAVVGAIAAKAMAAIVGGPVKNLSKFYMAPIPILSVLTCSASLPHNILKVSRKIIDHNPPVGQDQCDD
jgi:hypothetical protein